MSLTLQQQQFLNHFLQARPRTKDPLGGRQLSKIKGEYEKFCKERQKLSTLITQLKRLPRGDDFAATHEKSLDEVVKRVDTASTIGDETVFKPAYKDLEQIRKACEKDIEHRKKEIKAKDEQVAKYKKELQKALAEAEPKKAQKLQLLKAEMVTWLQNHHGSDTAEVWQICDKVVAALGGPQKSDLLLAARELEARTWTLAKDIEKVNDTGLDRIVLNTAYGFDTQVHQLLKDIDKYINAADKLNDGFSKTQLQRTQLEAMRLLWLVDPPPIPTDLPPPLLQVEGEDQIEDQPKNLEIKQPDVPLSQIDQGQKALAKGDNLIEHFETEYNRVKKNYEEIADEIGELRTKTAPAQALLAVDFQMLETAMGDAKRALESAEVQLTEARDERKKAEETLEGEWKPHILAIAAAVDTGLRELAVSEKATGQAEGGILYVERSFESIQSLKRRVEEVDEQLLDAVLQKIPLIPECDKTCAKDEELDMLKQLVFISGLENQKISAVVARATDQTVLDKVIKALIEGPKLSSQEMTSTLAKCQMICTDADRYFGSQGAFKNSLQDPAKSKFAKIQNAAKQDVAKYTIPFVLRPKRAKSEAKLNSVGVAIIGGGPIGLMAAVEARMSGASQVHVYEGRTDPYSRLNVLKIGAPQMQRFRAAGVFDSIFPNGVEPDSDGLASVKTIESALEARCGGLGIQLERGKFLKNVSRDQKGTVQLQFKGEEDTPQTCDLLIVATGSSVASAQKHADNVVLSDNLGIPFQKSSVKDFAAVGVFSKGAKGREGGKEQTDGWAYDFETDEVKYIVTQLSEEEYKNYCENPDALRARIIEDAQKVKMLDRSEENTPPQRVSTASKSETLTSDQLENEIDQAWTRLLQQLGGTQFYGRDVESDEQKVARAKKRALESLQQTLEKKKKENKEEKLSPAFVEDVVLTFLNMELGVSRFPMEFQQAQKFMTKDLMGVLVGDSAATPHPSTAKGLNTGVDEVGSIRDLVEDLETGGGSEEERKQAMQMYEWEVKRRTDVMVNEAMEALQTGARTRCLNLSRRIWLLLKQKQADYNAINSKISNHTKPMLVPKDSPQAKGDRDWKLREAAVKNLRAFEKQLLTAIAQIEQLLQTNPNGDLTTLMKPFDDLVA